MGTTASTRGASAAGAATPTHKRSVAAHAAHSLSSTGLASVQQVLLENDGSFALVEKLQESMEDAILDQKTGFQLIVDFADDENKKVTIAKQPAKPRGSTTRRSSLRLQRELECEDEDTPRRHRRESVGMVPEDPSRFFQSVIDMKKVRRTNLRDLAAWM